MLYILKQLFASASLNSLDIYLAEAILANIHRYSHPLREWHPRCRHRFMLRLNNESKLASSLDITVLIGSKSSRPCPVGFASVNKNRKFGRSGRSPTSAVNISCSTTRSALSVRVCQALWSEMLAIAFFIDDSSVYFVRGKTTSTIWLNVTRATWFPVSVTLKLWTNATRKFCRSLKCEWSTLIDLSTTRAISAPSPWQNVAPEADKVY